MTKPPKTPPGITPRQLVDGTWVYDVKVRLADGSTYQPRGFTRLRSEGDEVGAEDDMNDAKADARHGRPVRNRALLRVTVGELATAHLKAGKADWSFASARKYAYDWKAMEPTFGSKRLTELTSVDVGDWLTAQTAKYAPDTVAGRIGLLRTILDRGADQYGVLNVARLVKRKRSRNAKTRVRRNAIAAVDVAPILEAVDPRYRVLVLLCLVLGLRSGEARGLTLDRINFDTGEVVIDRQLVRRDADDPWDRPDDQWLVDKMGFAALKTPNSYATLVADPDLLDAIRAHVDLPAHRNRFGLIASTSRGTPVSDSMWSHTIGQVQKATGLDFVGHELRHTAGQWLYDATKDLGVVAAFLRDDVDTVRKVYVHQRAEASSSSTIMAGLAACKPRARGHLRVAK